ncbi:hypothetical protein CHISP_2895 [Chitinispirillum alkaliphilum]|nr:hypothetical protein CHISP_2895 [Chitinispirillum alkaliphilum]
MPLKTTALEPIIDDLTMIVEIFEKQSSEMGFENIIPAKFHEVSTNAYQLGIAHLLHTGDTEQFRENLIRSAKYRVNLLEQASKQPQLYDDYSYSYHLNPFFAAIISNDFPLARRIAELSEFPENPGYEYHDEFIYAKILYRFILNDCSPGVDSDALMQEYLEDCSGEEDARYRLLKSLSEKDEIQFKKSIRELLDSKAEYYEEIGNGLINDLVDFSTEQFVCLEGTALVVLARKLGLKTERFYRGIPMAALELS